MRKHKNYLIIQIFLWACVFICGNIIPAEAQWTDENKELIAKYGIELENAPFELRKEYYEQTNTSWRYLPVRDKLTYLQDWLDNHPDFKDPYESSKKKDPAITDEPSALQKKYGLYFENAPYRARMDFYNAYDQSWNDTDFREKEKYLQDWIEINIIDPKEVKQDVSLKVQEVLEEIHRKYGKDLYHAPFEARVEYFQTYNQSWREVEYGDRKLFILDWYERNEEKLRKFKEQLQRDLAVKLENELESAKMLELEIPKTYGKTLKDVPFELKRQYHIETQNSWNDATLEMKEIYTKRWLMEHKDVFKQEVERSRQIFKKKVEIREQFERNEEEIEKYREEVERRKKAREKAAKEKRKREEERKKAFRERFEDMRKRMQKLRDKSDRERNRN